MAADCSGVKTSLRGLAFLDENVKTLKGYHPRYEGSLYFRGNLVRASTLNKLAVRWGIAGQRAALPVLYSEALEPK